LATIEHFIPAQHPAADGHFPGNPIIPGAVLLSDTLRAIAQSAVIHITPCHIKSAKFFRPVRPGDRVLIEFTQNSPGEIKFTSMVDGKIVLAGQVKCAHP
jgi:3-hydroxyacyl-[acyl-carrier-protein] dehydratase